MLKHFGMANTKFKYTDHTALKTQAVMGQSLTSQTVPVNGHEKSGKNREVLSDELHSKPDISRRDILLCSG